MRMVFFLFLMSCTAKIFASDKSLADSILYSDIEQLVKLSREGSCEAYNYLIILRTKNTNLTPCDIKDKNIENNIFISSYSKLISSADFSKARNFYRRLPQSIKYDTDWITNFLELAAQGDFRAKSETIIFTHDFHSNLDIKNSKESFLLDTGATFSLYNTLHDISSKNSGYITSAFGSKTKMEHALFDVNKSGKHAFFINRNSNIIGHDLMSKFKYAVLASHKYDLKNGVHYYHDSNNIFINGILRIKEKDYKNVNICIDTGGDKSIITGRSYRKFRESIKNDKLVRFKFVDVAGEQSTNARLVKYAEAQIGNRIFRLHATPAVFSLDISLTCDVILGRDVLSGVITAFDFDKQIIFFND